MLSRRFFKPAAAGGIRDPFALLRQMTAEFERTFGWQPFGWPELRSAEAAWFPRIDVVKKDNRLVTRVDLPGVKKEDLTVEVMDGYLTIAGERKYDVDEERDDFYRAEREYGRFSRTVPLPEGVTPEEVKAVFKNGVLEVSVPVPVRAQLKPTKVEIETAEQKEMSAV